MNRVAFPFCACIGQKRMKKALILNLINPAVGGVLICGQRGTAKSTAVRALADLTDDVRVIDLPLNITEDRLFGTIDMERALKHGKKDFEPGLLQRAHNNILYVDEVNLLSHHIVNGLLEVAASGVNTVEREGISFRHDSRFVLVGTMNPEEGPLGTQFLDRFGLYVEVKGESEKPLREKIIENNIAFEQDPFAFTARYARETSALKGRIEEARKILPRVTFDDENVRFAASIARAGNCAGHRTEIIMIQTARAITAFYNRYTVREEDVREAAGFVLPHRRREVLPAEKKETPSQEPVQPEHFPPEDEKLPQDRKEPPETETQDSLLHFQDEPPEGCSASELEEAVQEPEEIEAELSLTAQNRKCNINQGSGKRHKVRTGSRQGRYVAFRFPRGKAHDIAFDATLRAAVIHQKDREKNGLAVKITKSDLLVKKREKKTGFTIVFLVDASGSMGAQRRMRVVKGTVISLLYDAYEKRDKVGVIAFQGQGAETLLPVTRSVDLAEKRLRELPAGGKTPLASGLAAAYEQIKAIKIRDPEALVYLVVVSDGKANQPFLTDGPIQDAYKIAEKLRYENVETIVLDCESGYIRFELARKLAEVLGADYVRLDDVSVSKVRNSVKTRIS